MAAKKDGKGPGVVKNETSDIGQDQIQYPTSPIPHTQHPDSNFSIGSSPLNWFSSPIADGHHMDVLSPTGTSMMSFSLTSPPIGQFVLPEFDGNALAHFHEPDYHSEQRSDHRGAGKIRSSADIVKSVFSPSIFSPTKNPDRLGIAERCGSSSVNDGESSKDEIGVNHFQTIFTAAIKENTPSISGDDAVTKKPKRENEKRPKGNKVPSSPKSKNSAKKKNMNVEDSTQDIKVQDDKADDTSTDAPKSVPSSSALPNGSYLHEKLYTSPQVTDIEVSSTETASTANLSIAQSTLKENASPAAIVFSPSDNQSNQSDRTDSCDRSTVGGNSTGNVQCKCRKSRCLKLYCDCFAVLNYCGTSCSCSNCYNSLAEETTRNEAITQIKERNALAFRSKISDTAGHAAGCHCRQSHCLKKYCECFTGGAYCANNCGCMNCANYYGSEELAKVKESSRKRKQPSESSTVSPPAETNKYNTPKMSTAYPLPPASTQKSQQILQDPHQGLYFNSQQQQQLQGKKQQQQLQFQQQRQEQPESSSKVRRSVKFVEEDVPCYPFFGEKNPTCPKVIALRCLEYLDNKDIYQVSLVNSIWSKAATDNALWE